MCIRNVSNKWVQIMPYAMADGTSDYVAEVNYDSETRCDPPYTLLPPPPLNCPLFLQALLKRMHLSQLMTPELKPIISIRRLLLKYA